MFANKQALIHVSVVSAIVISAARIVVPGCEMGEEKASEQSSERLLGPIGNAYCFSRFKLDGQLVLGEAWIWGNERLEAYEAPIEIVLNQIGRVTMTSWSIARLATGLPREAGQDKVLLITWVSGGVKARLERGVRAYTHANGLWFALESMTFEIHQGLLDRVSEIASKSQPEPIQIGRVDVNAAGEPVGPGVDRMKVKKGGIQEVWVQARDLTTGLAAVGRRLLFFVTNVRAGRLNSQTAEKVTNVFGTARATFTAGINKDSTQIVVSDFLNRPGSRSWVGTIDVIGPPCIFCFRNLAIGGVAVGGIICAVKCGGKDKPPLRQVPPPVVP